RRIGQKMDPEKNFKIMNTRSFTGLYAVTYSSIGLFFESITGGRLAEHGFLSLSGARIESEIVPGALLHFCFRLYRVCRCRCISCTAADHFARCELAIPSR